MATAAARPWPQLHPREPRLLQGRAQGEPLEELDDPPLVRAARAARRDPLHAPDEPLALRLLPFDAPASPWAPAPAGAGRDAAAGVRLVVQRELCTVAEARAAAAVALRVPAAELTLVLQGVALRRDDAVLWDEGAHAQRTLYWRRTPAPAPPAVMGKQAAVGSIDRPTKGNEP